MNDYDTLIAEKEISVMPSGKHVTDAEINPVLYDFQRSIVRWAARRGRAAIWADCGLGKSMMQLEWARLIGGRVLILAPLAVARQTVGEAKKIGLEIRYVKTPSEAVGDISITNYERLEAFDGERFDGVVADECFPAGTKVEVCCIDNSLGWMYIEDIVPGDRILNASGVDHVKACAKRRVRGVVALRFRGKEITCSENHPFLTVYGWKLARDIRPGDCLVETETAMRLVRGNIHTEILSAEVGAILRNVLLGEMADEPSRTQGESSHERDSRQDWAEGVCVASRRERVGEGAYSKLSGPVYKQKRIGTERYSDENIQSTPDQRAQTINTWREWYGHDGAREDISKNVRRRVETLYCKNRMQGGRRIPGTLQDRLWKYTNEDWNRSGWGDTSSQKAFGHKERPQAGLARVESVEILQRGDPRLEKLRDSSGALYFYDLEAERHPSFSVEGLLVHNSSILKSFSGTTRLKLIERFADTPYRLACTATPAPNDYLELGNHAQFLGIMTWQEMAATFFVHDQQSSDGNRGGNTGAWRLKGHAQDAFWKWLVTWEVFVKRPSDIGFDDSKFKLPPLRINPVVVKVNVKPDGHLFATGLHGIGERADVRRKTLRARVNASIECIIQRCNLINEGLGLKLTGTDCENSGEDSTESTETGGLPCQGNTEGLTGKKRTHTFDHGMQGTRSTSENTEGKQESGAMHEEGSCTESIPNHPGSRLGIGSEHTHEQRKTKGSESTVLQSTSTNACSKNKTGNALSVARICSPESTLIIATKQTESGEFSANHATLGSDTSKTTKRLLKEQWIIWCGLNDEQESICEELKNNGISFVSVRGGDDVEERTDRIWSFIEGKVDVIVSKPKVLGLGMNLQNTNKQVFVGMNDSYEAYYQCIRRSWRFGQRKPVDVHIVVSDLEESIVENVKRKESDAERMSTEMVARMSDLETKEINESSKASIPYRRDKATGNGWTMNLGDCVDVTGEMTDDSIDFSVYSPPFGSLYVYSASPRDMGNSKNEDQFFKQFEFLVKNLLRVTKPGRLTACHVAQLAAMASRDGFIGLKDFRGRVIQTFIAAGWIHHGEVVIDKNPQAQAIRTKTKGLLFVQLRKDASWMRPALADFLLVFRKPGENAVPVHPDITNEDWIKWAHPVWYDIRETETLTAAEGRDEKDEKHICPLQLDVIDRAVRLWSNVGETVLSPFAGIGSEGYQSIIRGRKFIGAELKESYWRAAVSNLRAAELKANEGTLFDKVE